MITDITKDGIFIKSQKTDYDAITSGSLRAAFSYIIKNQNKDSGLYEKDSSYANTYTYNKTSLKYARDILDKTTGKFIADPKFISFNELKETNIVRYPYSDEEVKSLEKAVDFAAKVEDACDRYAKENIAGYISRNRYIPKV